MYVLWYAISIVSWIGEVCVCACVCVCVCACVYVFACVHACIHTCVSVHAHMHAHTQAYVDVSLLKTLCAIDSILIRKVSYAEIRDVCMHIHMQQPNKRRGHYETWLLRYKTF